MRWLRVECVLSLRAMDCEKLPDISPTVREIGDAINYSAASLALLLFLGLMPAFFSTGARNFPV